MKIFYKILFFLRTIYRFIFRPHTKGVKGIIISGDSILLIRNSYGSNLRTLPGGGVGFSESLEQAIKREIKEEVGIVINHIIYLGNFISTLEYSQDTIHCFLTEVENQDFLNNSKEILEIRRFPIDSMPLDKGTIVEKALLLLKNHEPQK